jgi:hypothetical protein
MPDYIATFFHHFGATQFARKLERMGVESKLMPVPRRFSSSCGTCVRFSAEDHVPLIDREVDAIYLMEAGEACVYRNEE